SQAAYSDHRRELALILHAPQHLVISLLHAAEVAAETILVELLPRRLVPETAGVGTNFVAEQNLSVMASELELEIHQDHAALIEEFAEDGVDLQRHRIDLLELFGGGPAKHYRMLAEDQRIVERVRFVVVLDYRMRQRFAFFAAEPLGHRARDDIPHHGLDRDDIQALAQHLAIVQTADEVRLHSLFFEQREKQLRHPVVDHALGLDRVALGAVERRRVVLEVGDDEVGVGRGVEFLRLALVKHFEFLRSRFHVAFSHFGRLDYPNLIILPSGHSITTKPAPIVHKPAGSRVDRRPQRFTARGRFASAGSEVFAAGAKRSTSFAASPT